MHILKFPTMQSTSISTNILVELRVWLKFKDTQPDIVSFIILGFASWFSMTPYPVDERSLDIPTLLAFKTQHLLGWE